MYVYMYIYLRRGCITEIKKEIAIATYMDVPYMLYVYRVFFVGQNFHGSIKVVIHRFNFVQCT